MHPHPRQNTSITGLSGGQEALLAAPHRFGFNGQERDDEVSGEGNSLSFKYRVEDTRLGRFFSVDPMCKEFPWNSTYAFAENKVVWARELEGLETWYTNEGNKQNTSDIGESGPTKEISGPLDDGYATMNKLKDANTPLRDFEGKKAIIAIIPGSKPLPQYSEQPANRKSTGGLSGGHVYSVLVDGAIGNAYGFTNETENPGPVLSIKGDHVFPSNRNSNGVFQKKTSGEIFHDAKMFQQRMLAFDVTSILTIGQFHSIADSYQGEPAYDYAVFGKRCASSAYSIFADAGVFIKKSPLSEITFTPGKFIDFLKEKGITPTLVNEGYEGRKYSR